MTFFSKQATLTTAHTVSSVVTSPTKPTPHAKCPPHLVFSLPSLLTTRSTVIPPLPPSRLSSSKSGLVLVPVNPELHLRILKLIPTLTFTAHVTLSRHEPPPRCTTTTTFSSLSFPVLPFPTLPPVSLLRPPFSPSSSLLTLTVRVFQSWVLSVPSFASEVRSYP